jgi:hypothetical protein
VFLVFIAPALVAIAGSVPTLSLWTSTDIPRSIDLAQRLNVDTDNAAAYLWYPGTAALLALLIILLTTVPMLASRFRWTWPPRGTYDDAARPREPTETSEQPQPS